MFCSSKERNPASPFSYPFTRKITPTAHSVCEIRATNVGILRQSYGRVGSPPQRWVIQPAPTVKNQCVFAGSRCNCVAGFGAHAAFAALLGSALRSSKAEVGQRVAALHLTVWRYIALLLEPRDPLVKFVRCSYFACDESSIQGGESQAVA
jgi:hypothetical protein